MIRRIDRNFVKQQMVTVMNMEIRAASGSFTAVQRAQRGFVIDRTVPRRYTVCTVDCLGYGDGGNGGRTCAGRCRLYDLDYVTSAADVASSLSSAAGSPAFSFCIAFIRAGASVTSTCYSRH